MSSSSRLPIAALVVSLLAIGVSWFAIYQHSLHQVPAPQVAQSVPGEYHESTTTTEVGGSTDRTRDAAAQGNGLTTSAAEQAAQFHATAPTVTDETGTSDAGDTDTSFTLKGIKFDVLWLFAAIFAGLGLFCYAAPPPLGLTIRRGARPCFIAAAVCAGCAWLGAPVVIALGVVAAGGFLFYVWEVKNHSVTQQTTIPTSHALQAANGPREALRAVLGAANQLPKAAYDQFNNLLHQHADSNDATEIAAVRAADNLTGPPPAPVTPQ